MPRPLAGTRSAQLPTTARHAISGPQRGARRLLLAALASMSIASCFPPCIEPSPCADDGECPAGHRCAPLRHVCYPDALQDAAALDGASPCRAPRRKRLTASGTLSPVALAEFPLLVALPSDPDLAAHARSDGADIRFVAEDGVSALPHELESYNAGNGSLAAWVLLPQLNGGEDSVLHMVFGDGVAQPSVPDQVWDDDYVGVWHLDDALTGAREVRDSSGQGNHGTASATMLGSDRVAGRVGAGYQFRAADTLIDLGNAASLRLTGAMTVEAWFRASAAGNWEVLSKSGLGGNRGWDLSFDDGAPGELTAMFRYSIDGAATQYVTSWALLALEPWHHMAGVFEPGQAARFYLDGVLDAQLAYASHTTLHDASVGVGLGGRLDGYGEGFRGTIDEVRISRSARSVHWIAAQVANLTHVGSPVAVGEMELLPAACDGG